MSEEIRSLIVVSDLHCGCQFGLCPPEPQLLDGGGYYMPSDLQKAVWEWWDEFWEEWVPMVTDGTPYAVLINGDTTDGVHHRSTTQISHNLNDQKEIAKRILTPIVEKCKGRFYMIRGTEAHVGPSGENEEMLAKELGAIPNETGNYARWDMWAEVGNGLVHALHHIGTTGSTAYESTAPMKEIDIAFSEAGRWHERPPDVVVRSHRHRCIIIDVPTFLGEGIIAITPGWQLKTPFVWKMAGARQTTPQFGGICINAGDEDPIYVRKKVWKIPPSKTVKL